MSRKLRPEELELWQKIADQTQPLAHQRGKKQAGIAKGESKKQFLQNLQEKAMKPVVFEGKSEPQNQFKRPPSLEESLRAAPVQMDLKSFAKMKRGKLKPEGRIDLHGMTLARAHPALTGFILSAQSSGKRLVLVITGKGKDKDTGGPIPTRVGVLRHQVPQWLSLPPLSQAILQVSQSHKSHGGEGAYYVYLRKFRG